MKMKGVLGLVAALTVAATAASAQDKVLAIVVKGFFTPLMMGIVVGHLNGISRAWLTHKHLPSMDFKVAAGASILTSVQMWWTHVGVRLGDLVPSGSDLAALVQP